MVDRGWNGARCASILEARLRLSPCGRLEPIYRSYKNDEVDWDVLAVLLIGPDSRFFSDESSKEFFAMLAWAREFSKPPILGEPSMYDKIEQHLAEHRLYHGINYWFVDHVRQDGKITIGCTRKANTDQIRDLIKDVAGQDMEVIFNRIVRL